jgi:hypothetical protein
MTAQIAALLAGQKTSDQTGARKRTRRQKPAV